MDRETVESVTALLVSDHMHFSCIQTICKTKNDRPIISSHHEKNSPAPAAADCTYTEDEPLLFLTYQYQLPLIRFWTPRLTIDESALWRLLGKHKDS